MRENDVASGGRIDQQNQTIFARIMGLASEKPPEDESKDDDDD